MWGCLLKVNHILEIQKKMKRVIRDDEIWVNLNKIRNDNPSEMLQTIEYLKEKLKGVKEDNERILKA